jgi:hypothetical protein
MSGDSNHIYVDSNAKLIVIAYQVGMFQESISNMENDIPKKKVKEFLIKRFESIRHSIMELVEIVPNLNY